MDRMADVGMYEWMTDVGRELIIRTQVDALDKKGYHNIN